MLGFRIHKEGMVSLIITAIVSLALIFVGRFLPPVLSLLLAILAGALFLIVLQFFRNPVRKIPIKDNQLVYAPADGKVVVMVETE